MQRYITSDWHFGHRNICGPNGFVATRKDFKNPEEMNEAIIKAINSVVTNADELYHLGDIAINMKPKDVLSTLSRIKGQIHLVKGNHDSNKKVLNYLKNHDPGLPDGRNKFVFYEVGTIIKRNGVQFYLTHYPIGLGEARVNIRSICGHIHEEKAKEANCLNVGIDSAELPKNQEFGVPLTMDQAMDLVNDKWQIWKDSQAEGIVKWYD